MASPESVGQITLGDFQERFRSLTTFWTPQNYEAQWRDALHRIVGNHDRSGLVTSISAPGEADFLVWWPMYRDGEVVHVQNAYLFFDDLPTPFDPQSPFTSVPERTVVTEDGDPVSEWSVPVSSIRSFIAQEYGS